MRWNRAGALYLVLVVSSVSYGAQQPTAAEQEVMQVQARRAKAVMAQDIAALEPMIADELSYCHASAQVEDKASYLKTVKTGRIRWVTMMPEGMKARVYGDTAVITLDDLSMPLLGTYSARVMIHNGFYSGVWYCNQKNYGGVLTGRILKQAEVEANKAAGKSEPNAEQKTKPQG